MELVKQLLLIGFGCIALLQVLMIVVILWMHEEIKLEKYAKKDCKRTKELDYVWRLTELDIQDQALMILKRTLTEEEMHLFKNKFTIHEWDETVREYIKEYIHA